MTPCRLTSHGINTCGIIHNRLNLLWRKFSVAQPPPHMGSVRLIPTEAIITGYNRLVYLHLFHLHALA